MIKERTNKDLEWLLEEASSDEFWWVLDRLLGYEFWNKKRDEIKALKGQNAKQKRS